jgi:hypothetical protein
MNVRTFRSPHAHALFAVDATWSAEASSGGATSRLDVVGALGLGSRIEAAPSRSIVFGRGNVAFEVETRAAPTLAVAARLFPPDAESSIEVVLVGNTEAILIRPDLLAAESSHSTVPPPTVLSPSHDAPATPPERGYDPTTLRPQR